MNTSSFKTLIGASLIVVGLSFPVWNIIQDAKDTGFSLAAQPYSIKVKNLYLGMSIEEAHAEVTNFLKDYPNWAKSISSIVVDNNQEKQFEFGILGKVMADKDGKVRTVIIPGNVSAEIFKASSLTAEDFARAFVKAYDVPELKLGESKEVWLYTYSDGTRVGVNTEKTVFLNKVESKREIASTFN